MLWTTLERLPSDKEVKNTEMHQLKRKEGWIPKDFLFQRLSGVKMLTMLTATASRRYLRGNQVGGRRYLCGNQVGGRRYLRARCCL